MTLEGEFLKLQERNAKLVAALELAKKCIRSGVSDDFPLTRLENETMMAINPQPSQQNKNEQ